MIKTSYDLLVSELHSSHLASVLDGQLDGGVVHQLADLQGARVVIRFASQSKEFEQGFNLKKTTKKASITLQSESSHKYKLKKTFRTQLKVYFLD